jgi:trehalose 6-phosphate synthase
VLSERECAVVLSRDAGVADEYAPDALMVNPYDVTETAEALHAALSMPLPERQDRRKRLLAAATALPPADWFRQQLDALD